MPGSRNGPGAPGWDGAPFQDVEPSSVKGLVKAFKKRTVVDGVSFQVRAGEIVGLLGPNGAGKTTSFRMTVGLTRPDAGEVRLRGEECSRLPMYKRARLGMGYLPQDRSIFQRCRCATTCARCSRRCPTRASNARARPRA
jgi:ABC-type lipopolysaccharide export system ATPase subunit